MLGCVQEQAKQQGEQQQQAQEQQQDQQQEAQEEVPLTELEQQLLLCYRKTFLVAGLGLAGSVWRWNAVTKHKRKDIFLPPRAQALPEAVSDLQAGFSHSLPMSVGVGCIIISGN